MAARPSGRSPLQPDLAGSSSGRPPVLQAPAARRIPGRRVSSAALGARRFDASGLNVVSYNVHGLGAGANFRPGVAASGPCPHSKAERLARLLRSLRADVVLAQEICANPELCSFLEGVLTDWLCFWAPAKAPPRSGAHGDGERRLSAGVAIFVRKRALIQFGGHLRVVEQSFRAQRDGRLASIRVTWMGHSLHLASIYQPNDHVLQRAFIRDQLSAEAKSLGAGGCTCVWGGDFNFVPDLAKDRVTNGLAPPASHPDARSAAEWAKELPDLVDTFRALHPQRRSFTYFHNQGASRLDRIYVSTKGLPYVTAAAVATGSNAPGAVSLSDHRPVTMTLMHRAPLCAPRRRTGTHRTLAPRVRTEFLRDANLAEQYRAKVADLAADAPGTTADLLRWWPGFKSDVARAARTFNAMHRAVCIARMAEAEAVLEELQQRVAAGEVSAAAQLPSARRAAHSADASATRNLREQHTWLHPREQPSPGLTARLRPPTDVSCGPSLRSPAGALVSTPGACAEIMVAHCAAISAKQPVQRAARDEVLAALAGNAQLPEDAGGGATVDEAEVRAVLRTARPTQPGLDGLKAVLYRAAKETFVPLLARVFSAIGSEGRLPPGFHTGVIVPLHKSGDRTRAGNYRPITLLNTDYRLLAAVLGARLAPHLLDVIDPVQTAFLRGRSIGENIWALQVLPHALAAEGRSGVLAVCDFKKAYDTVDRGFLLEVMRRLGAGDMLLKWVTLLLDDSAARALVMGQLSTLTTFDSGVRQGCPLAPLLYLFVGQALLSFLKARGIGMPLPTAPVLEPWDPVQQAGTQHLPPYYSPLAPTLLFAPATGLQLAAVERSTAFQFADDCKALLPSFLDVPPFLDAMATFADASNQHLSMDKTRLLEIGAVGPAAAAPKEVQGLKVVDKVKALGIHLHRGVTPASAPWEEMLSKVQACYRRASHVRLSAFGRGFASAAYGVSQLMHAAEYAGLPAAIAETLQKSTAALVDRDEAPGVPRPAEDERGAGRGSFAGARSDLLCGSPAVGGFGALDFQSHLTARAAKWALRLLIDGTSRPWTKLVWAVLAQAFPRGAHFTALTRHLHRLQYDGVHGAGEFPPQLPGPVNRLLQALQALPALGRRVTNAQGGAEPRGNWLYATELIAWRLHYQHAYATSMFALGAPAWSMPTLAPTRETAGASLWDYSVKMGMQLLTTPALEERAGRFHRFVGEAGGSLPPTTSAAAAMSSALRALWGLPLPNALKQDFWYCYLDALPTAARRHTPRAQRCHCGSGPERPDRKHHFGDCPVAAAVVAAVTQCIPPRTDGNVLAELRAVAPPPGVHAGVWAIVTLAAHAAMEAGRRRLHNLVREGKASPGSALTDQVSTFAIQQFRSTLTEACSTPLPSAWRRAAAVGHPFMGWNAAAGRWLPTPPPS